MHCNHPHRNLDLASSANPPEKQPSLMRRFFASRFLIGTVGFLGTLLIMGASGDNWRLAAHIHGGHFTVRLFVENVQPQLNR
jgi:hypothetical protein